MAKNSAKSKGYRKTKQKKPFLTKGELIGAIVILVVFVIALACVLNEDILFTIFPDGNLAGSQVKDGDIATYADQKIKTRFVKIGEIGELDGYTCKTSFNKSNVPTSYTFNPEAEDSTVSYVTVSGSAMKAAELPQNYLNTITGMGASIEATEVVESTIQDHPAYIYSYISEFYDAASDPNAEATEGEEHENNVFRQNFTAYVDVDGTHTMCLHINCEYPDASGYLPADQVEEFTKSFAGSFTIIDPVKK